METFSVCPVGVVSGGGEGPAQLRISPEYRDGLRGLEGFGHAVVLWWAHEVDNPELRGLTDAGRPYVHLDHDLGIFTTRSPLRPNPIGLTVIELAAVDVEAGLIATPYLDANDGTPLLDLKPYTPSIDRIENPTVPTWCAHWPQSVESSADFDWAGEFRF